MSTGLLYHAFGIRGHRYRRTEYQGGGIVFTITKDRDELCCSACSCYEVTLRGSTERSFLAPPIGGKPVTIVWDVPRLECVECGAVRQAAVTFADEYRQHTKSFERYALDLSREMTISAVARHLGVGWDLVKDIQKRHLGKKYARQRLKDLRLLAIDEIHVSRKQGYLTVVMDLESGAVVHVAKGRNAACLSPFFRRLKASRARIEAVAIDMSKAYIHAVRTELPEAAIVFDRFHVAKLMNEKLSDLRRELEAEGDGSVETGLRWLLVKNQKDLDEDAAAKLERALEVNRPLATAYYLKEDLRLLWQQIDKEEAEEYLDDWIEQAKASGIGILKRFATTLDKHRDGLLAWYDHPISTAPLEGMNNKIRVLNRKAYAYRDMEFFKLKIMDLHESRQVLVG
jgi:transposase